MPTCELKPISRQLLLCKDAQIRNQIQLCILRHYAKCKCDCEKTGICKCSADCECRLRRKKVSRLGPKKICCRDPPPSYAPKCLETKAFEIPEFISPKAFRPMKPDEQLGPRAGKSKEYKNPEFFSYHNFSYYDLKMAAGKAKDLFEGKKP